jgi:hypothetical protein
VAVEQTLEQTRREDEAAVAGLPLVVCDTDAFAASVSERRYLGGLARGLQPWATTALPRAGRRRRWQAASGALADRS